MMRDRVGSVIVVGVVIVLPVLLAAGGPANPARTIELAAPVASAGDGVATDAGPAVRDAIARAKALGPGARVQLGAGRFVIDSSADEQACDGGRAGVSQGDRWG